MVTESAIPTPGNGKNGLLKPPPAPPNPAQAVTGQKKGRTNRNGLLRGRIQSSKSSAQVDLAAAHVTEQTDALTKALRGYMASVSALQEEREFLLSRNATLEEQVRTLKERLDQLRRLASAND